MKVLIVDDEPIMLLTMKRMLSSIEGIELVGSFQQMEEAFTFLCKHDVDLAFLDIEIADKNGIELARNLRSANTDLDIVFTTSHADYAIQAYDVYPLDYMMKPISKSRLAQTITRAFNRRHSSSNVNSPVLNRLKVQTFGCLEVSSSQQGEVKWRSKKSKELFVYLLVNRGRSVGKMKVIDDIFPEMPLKNAEIYLNTAVYQLRKALSTHGFKENMISGQEKYRLELSNVDVDFIQFEQGVGLLTQINNENESVALELEKQVVGELFEGQSFSWAALEQESITLMYASFAKRLADWLLTCERQSEALEVVKRVLKRDVFDEEANQLLLNIYGVMGDLYALHNHYQQYVQIMQQEFNLQPTAAMQMLYRKYSS